MLSTRRSLSGVIFLTAFIILQLTTATKSDDSATSPTTWEVSESNATCILLRASISLSVNYTDVYNHNRTHLVKVDVPASAKSSGSCAPGEQQYIELSWTATVANSTKPQALNNTLTITFLANSTGNSSAANSTSGKVPHGLYAIVKVVAVLHKVPSELFPNVTNLPVPFVLTLESNSSFLGYPTSLNHSYTCDSVLKLSPNPFSGTDSQLTVSLDQSQVEAFRREKNDDVFESAEHCPADEISSGSIVGTVILTIGIIVLIALGVAALATYVLKKRRATGGTGYENM